ncbi:MAG: V-type ATP synthase subunit D [Thermoplasmata archaeon]|nr:MAG: V-type ATP synthase subunit D [Thermoplasmata archaeon]
MVAKKLEDVNANRMELLIIRRRIALAEKGHKLLSEKRDALVMQFMRMLEEYENLRKAVLDSLQTAYETLIESEMMMGQIKLDDIANRIPPVQDLSLSTRNIIGVTIPELVEAKLPPMDKFQYGLMDTNAKLDETVLNFRGVLPDILKLAVAEAGLEKVAREIEKTKRRVNALEYIFIPRLKNTKRYIEMQLQERERQDFFRRKRIKALLLAANKKQSGG